MTSSSPLCKVLQDDFMLCNTSPASGGSSLPALRRVHRSVATVQRERAWSDSGFPVGLRGPLEANRLGPRSRYEVTQIQAFLDCASLPRRSRRKKANLQHLMSSQSFLIRGNSTGVRDMDGDKMPSFLEVGLHRRESSSVGSEGASLQLLLAVSVALRCTYCDSGCFSPACIHLL